MSNYQSGLTFKRIASGFYHVINIRGVVIGHITRGRDKKGTWWNVKISTDLVNKFFGEFAIRDPHLHRSFVGFVDAKDWFRDHALSNLHTYESERQV